MVREMTFSRFRQRLDDESGMSYVFMGMGLMAFLSASMLAIDVGMLMTARNQAQNSADAGALAGAVALGFDNFNDRSPSGPAVTHAISAAKSNDVMAADVDVDPERRRVPQRRQRSADACEGDRVPRPRDAATRSRRSSRRSSACPPPASVRRRPRKCRQPTR